MGRTIKSHSIATSVGRLGGNRRGGRVWIMWWEVQQVVVFGSCGGRYNRWLCLDVVGRTGGRVWLGRFGFGSLVEEAAKRQMVFVEDPDQFVWCNDFCDRM